MSQLKHNKPHTVICKHFAPFHFTVGASKCGFVYLSAYKKFQENVEEQTTDGDETTLLSHTP